MPQDSQQQDKVVAVLSHIESAICKNTQWTGQTTRELRDMAELSAKHVEILTARLDQASISMTSALDVLTQSINRQSESSEVLSHRMVWLTCLLVLATIVMAVTSVIGMGK